MERRDCLRAGIGLAASGMVPLLSAQAQAAKSAPVPMEAFARRPLLEQLSLSPDGKLLAAIVNSGKDSLIVVRPTAGGAFKTLARTDNLELMFNWIKWVNNERLVFSTRHPSGRREKDNLIGNVEATETRLHAINADGSNLLNLIKNWGASGKNLEWAYEQDNVIDWMRGDGKHILITLPASELNGWPAVFKVNVDTAERTGYSNSNSRERIYGWMTDDSHRVRLGMARTTHGERERVIHVCDPDGSNWRVLSQMRWLSPDVWWPLGFGLDPNLLYVWARHEGLAAVFTLDLRQPDAKLQLKLAHPRYDLNGSLIYDLKGEAVGVRQQALGDSSSFYWDERYKELQLALDEALPDRFNQLYSASRDGRTFVVRSDEPGRPPCFYIGYIGEQARMELLADCYPELLDQPLASKRPFDMKARDGMELHGFLAFPPGTDEKSGKLPLVVYPHGGPHAADGPEFSPRAAFMADRGCLVMQLNFRGSTGYGRKYLEAGYRQWGRAMQEDLEDGVAELVKRGLADPARVVIVGGSYGGYAALMGLIKTPDLYRGGFAIAPVTDLLEMAEDDGQWGWREETRAWVGDFRDDKDLLRANSPCLHAARIKVPVALVHGTHDRVVHYRHSEKMAEALKAAGKPHQLIRQQHGDHYLSHQGYRLELHAALEKFLRQTLGV